MSASVTSTERLQRLLALVPYVVSRKVVGLAETAAAFGVSERELVDDLNLLWCVELRAPDPYCPIDLSYEGGEIVVSQAESIARPLRLAVDEASALLVALRMLAEVPGLEDRSAMSRLIAKLEDGRRGGRLGQRPGRRAGRRAGRRRRRGGGRPDRCRAGRRAAGAPALLRPGAGRGDRARRGPDATAGGGGAAVPGGLVLRAEGVRLFRLDRVLALEVLDVPASPPAEAEHRRRRPGPVPALGRRRTRRTRAVRPRALGGRVLPVRVGDPTWRTAGCGWCCARPDTGWVRRLALRLGEDGRVVSPPELAAEIRDAAAAALANYAELSAVMSRPPGELRRITGSYSPSVCTNSFAAGRRVDSGSKDASP